MKIEELSTPCLVLDRAKLERNLERMSSTVHRNGAALRPHLKTAKSAAVARLATAAEAGGITVSTLAEAEYFAGHGFRDILVAAAQPPGRLDRAAALIENGVMLTLVCDDVALGDAIMRHSAHFRVMVELDSGDRRAGVNAESPDLIDVGRALGSKLVGVMTHAGHSYECRNIECIKGVAEHERNTVVTAAERLRALGLRCEVVSAGSTPTMTHAVGLEGVTEARPGVYMFQDLFQAEIGSCSKDDIAVTVLASVIGRRKAENSFLVDAGSLALSKDRSTQMTRHDAGYGEVWDVRGQRVFGTCLVQRAYQEHGVAQGSEPLPFSELGIGSKVRIAPNHACLTAAAYDKYYVTDGGDEIVDVWDRVNGW